MGAAVGISVLLLLQSIGWKIPLLLIAGVIAARYLFRYLFRKAWAAFAGESPPAETVSPPAAAPAGEGTP
jgi:hypothetical protein